jgi:hypothetical protein
VQSLPLAESISAITKIETIHQIKNNSNGGVKYLISLLCRHDANIVNVAATESKRVHVSEGYDALKRGIHTRFFLNIDTI